MEHQLGPGPLGQGALEEILQDLQGLHQPGRVHVVAGAPGLLGQVTVAAVEVAALRGVEIDRGRQQAEPDVVEVRGQAGFFFQKHLGQLRPQKICQGLVPGGQHPEGGVRVDQGHEVVVADLQNVEMGPGPGIHRDSRRTPQRRNFLTHAYLAFLASAMR